MPIKAPRKDFFVLLLILAAITFIMILSGGCGCNQIFTLENLSVQKNSTSVSLPPPDVLEVYHFHATQQCYTCQVLGELAEETITTRFAQELSGGNLMFAHVNAELPENAEFVSRYGVISSSLMIGYTDETGFHAENQIGLWYKLGDKEAFADELEETLNKKLGTNKSE